MDKREALIRLNLISGLGSVTVHRLMEAFESPEAIFEASPTVLKEVLGRWGTDTVIKEILRADGDQGMAQELQRAEKRGVRMITLLDLDYPELLKTIADPPPVLYIKGTLIQEDIAAVAVVGTRAASPYGASAARSLSGDLARSGITVVSGLAEGIDGIGHEGALEAGGRTIAVLGHGLHYLYPPQHRKLAGQVAGSGCLVSEFPMEVGPRQENFPRRNRLIAGLSLGVIVVEAPLRSGALITAREALEQGREVFAVPGPISSPRSKGCHQLLKEGARLVEGVQDVLETLGPALKNQCNRFIQQPTAALNPPALRDLSKEEAVVFHALPVGSAAGVDALAHATALAPSKLLGLLTSLELGGLIRQIPGQGYSRLS